MRVRLFGLRMIATGLVALWTLAAALVLLGYRPGGPFDLLVGAATAGPVAIGLAALAWPPLARGDRALAGIVWIGLGTALLLAPSIGGMVNQLTGRGLQTLLPSAEAAYPWLLALFGTSLLAGIGIARRLLGHGARRRHRLAAGIGIAVSLTAVAGSIFTAIAVANELALRDRPAIASRFGPTGPEEPPDCGTLPAAGPAALLDVRLSGIVDRRSLGTAEIRGIRSGDDFRWTAVVATTRTLGQYGAARVRGSAWTRAPGSGWRSTQPASLEAQTLDRRVLEAVLASPDRAIAEQLGIDFIEGARARHCRIAVDGTAFRAAFPQVEWLVGGADLGRWRGELDFWIFSDGQVGQVEGSVNGEAGGLHPPGLLATVSATLTATDRDRDLRITAPDR